MGSLSLREPHPSLVIAGFLYRYLPAMRQTVSGTKEDSDGMRHGIALLLGYEPRAAIVSRAWPIDGSGSLSLLLTCGIGLLPAFRIGIRSNHYPIRLFKPCTLSRVAPMGRGRDATDAPLVEGMRDVTWITARFEIASNPGGIGQSHVTDQGLCLIGSADYLHGMRPNETQEPRPRRRYFQHAEKGRATIAKSHKGRDSALFRRGPDCQGRGPCATPPKRAINGNQAKPIGNGQGTAKAPRHNARPC